MGIKSDAGASTPLSASSILPYANQTDLQFQNDLASGNYGGAFQEAIANAQNGSYGDTTGLFNPESFSNISPANISSYYQALAQYQPQIMRNAGMRADIASVAQFIDPSAGAGTATTGSWNLSPSDIQAAIARSQSAAPGSTASFNPLAQGVYTYTPDKVGGGLFGALQDIGNASLTLGQLSLEASVGSAFAGIPAIAGLGTIAGSAIGGAAAQATKDIVNQTPLTLGSVAAGAAKSAVGAEVTQLAPGITSSLNDAGINPLVSKGLTKAATGAITGAVGGELSGQGAVAGAVSGLESGAISGAVGGAVGASGLSSAVSDLTGSSTAGSVVGGAVTSGLTSLAKNAITSPSGTSSGGTTAPLSPGVAPIMSAGGTVSATPQAMTSALSGTAPALGAAAVPLASSLGSVGTPTSTAIDPAIAAAAGANTAAPASSFGSNVLSGLTNSLGGSSLGTTLGQAAPYAAVGALGLAQAQQGLASDKQYSQQLTNLGQPMVNQSNTLLNNYNNNNLNPQDTALLANAQTLNTQIQNSTAGLSSIAQQAFSSYLSGTLPPGTQAALDAQVQAQKQQVAQSLSSSGIADSTILAGAYANIDNQALITKQNLLNQMFATGNQAYDTYLTGTAQGQSILAGATQQADSSLQAMLSGATSTFSAGAVPITQGIQTAMQTDANYSQQVAQLMGTLTAAYAKQYASPAAAAAGGAAAGAAGALGSAASGITSKTPVATTLAGQAAQGAAGLASNAVTGGIAGGSAASQNDTTLATDTAALQPTDTSNFSYLGDPSAGTDLSSLNFGG